MNSNYTSGPTENAFNDHEHPMRMIRVVAPAKLPAGYELQVQSKDSPGETFFVTIPSHQGSYVQEGEIFLAPIPPGYKTEELIDVPTGRWKDGLFDFWSYGFFHPHFWCAMCCKEFAMAQVMQRLRLSWLGEPLEGDRALSTFRTVVTIVCCYVLFDFSMDVLMGFNGQGEYYYSTSNPILPILKNVVALLFAIWSTFALYKMRRNVRSEFSIPEQHCHGYEDCMCAVFCGCCSVAQIARHTGNYETYSSMFCTETGLPNHAPFAAPMTV